MDSENSRTAILPASAGGWAAFRFRAYCAYWRWGVREGGGGKSCPICIGDNVFIGARAIILKGVTIGEGSVIGAGAVVAKDIPPFSIAVGNPVRVIGDSRKKYNRCR